MSARRLKVLCLHGYHQNIDIFKSKSGGFRKLFKSIDFVFIDAPHLIPKESWKLSGDKAQEDIKVRSWWFSSKNPESFASAQACEISKGFEDSLELIKKTFEEQGPFDGLLGFSQGAAFVSLLCCLKTLGKIDYDFKFVILVAAFKSLSSHHLVLFDQLQSMGKRIDIPSIHFIGETDEVIAKERSEDLMQHFSSAQVVYHKGGHLVPSSANTCNKSLCKEFFDNFL